MYTFKDLDVKTVFVINCIEHERSLRVMNGELLLEEKNGENNFCTSPDSLHINYYRISLQPLKIKSIFIK